MRSSYLVAASLAASVALAPALALAADVGAKPQSPNAPPSSALPAAPLSPALSEKAGCGAVLVILGQIADGYPEAFAKSGGNGKGIRTMLSAFGLKGKAMMDEAFSEGSAQGLTPSQTYEGGVAGLLASVKSDVADSSPQEASRKAVGALMKRCTGIGD